MDENLVKQITTFRAATRGGRSPIRKDSYSKNISVGISVGERPDTESMKSIISNGSPADIGELSRYYYRYSGIYSRSLLYYASLLLYDTVIVPRFSAEKTPSKNVLLRQFQKACNFVDKIDPQRTLSYITLKILINGVYYGVLRETADELTIQDLPIAYCRVRFKDMYGLNIPEFNMDYFSRISDEALREEAIKTYPREVQKAWRAYKNGTHDKWVEIPSSIGGMCFFYGEDTVPFMAASIPNISELEDAREREAQRDTNELYKLLIQKMPISSKTDQLIFSLPEVTELHNTMADMLSSVDNIDILTTFGDIKMENVQDSDAASASQDRLNKYTQAAYAAIGTSHEIFNAETATGIEYSIKKDILLMHNWAQMYELWMRVILNDRFAAKQITFDIEILPTTIFNQKEIAKQFLDGAQFGYSKFYASVALGIKQSNLISLITFENDILDLTNRMIPLQSSYTTSGTDFRNDQKSGTEAKTQEEENKKENVTEQSATDDIQNSGNANSSKEASANG